MVNKVKPMHNTLAPLSLKIRTRTLSYFIKRHPDFWREGLGVRGNHVARKTADELQIAETNPFELRFCQP